MKFTENDTKKFYDEHDNFYRTFWDKEGSHHWGIFEKTPTIYDSDTFERACIRSNEILASTANFTTESVVLDVCCGNGINALWIAEKFGCQVVGIDISDVRIQNANRMIGKEAKDIQDRVNFYNMSITQHQLKPRSFTHAWSQSSLYHVHEKYESIRQIHSLLKEGGLFIFDDLFKGLELTTLKAQKFVYDRMLFETTLDFETYKETLNKIGFKILNKENFTPHLLTSYRFLAALTKNREGVEQDPRYQEFSKAYTEVANIIANGELCWGMFVCQKEEK